VLVDEGQRRMSHFASARDWVKQKRREKQRIDSKKGEKLNGWGGGGGGEEFVLLDREGMFARRGGEKRRTVER